MDIDTVSPSPAGDRQTIIPSSLRTEWFVLATIDAAHGIHEINHITWTKRAGRKRQDTTGPGDDEILVSTADDGSVKVWTIDR
jgi:hypothetical protein